ncbi:MAG: sulfurtransferase, partial [Geminicoccaceae bacterium]
DDYHHMLAGRIWWAMRYFGFDNVRILNGGWPAWQAKGFPVSTAEPTVAAGTFEPEIKEHLLISLDAFLQQKDQALVWDARGSEGYRGRPDDDRTGHIPGVMNLPFRSVLDEETGFFKDDGALARLFDDDSPGWRQRRIISSCGSGYAGTVLLVALKQLGVDASLFDGSFAIWKQDPKRPIEQGDGAKP